MRDELVKLKALVLEDGVVDAAEVKAMRAELIADGVIDREEADFLFEINDAVTGKENSAAWPVFFANALTAHVLADETTPNVVDEDEATYLIEKIGADGVVDSAEAALLANIAVHATEIHASLTEKYAAQMK